MLFKNIFFLIGIFLFLQRQKDPEKRQPHRAIVYLATHRKRAKDKPEPAQNEHVIQLEDLIHKEPELAQNDRGRIAWEGDALHQVLGEEKAGQVHGMGLLPVPKQVYGRLPRRFKSMNISTQDTSSYDGEADGRMEIARLWEHIQKQDMVIGQLRNQQGSHENHETRENRREKFADNSQTHAVNFVRKRVCNVPDPLGSLTRERETTLNKDTVVDNHDMYSDNDEEFLAGKYLEHGNDNGLAYKHGSSSIPLSTNDFLQEKNKMKQNFQDTTVRTQRRQDTQSRTQCHIPSKRKHSPSMEDGTKIILKTHVYPNRRRVAYATFITNSPTHDVAGVLLGSEFTHVSLDKVIDAKEKLVRERFNCKTIGDACAVGLTIAWPSAFIENMNFKG